MWFGFVWWRELLNGGRRSGWFGWLVCGGGGY